MPSSLNSSPFEFDRSFIFTFIFCLSSAIFVSFISHSHIDRAGLLFGIVSASVFLSLLLQKKKRLTCNKNALNNMSTQHPTTNESKMETMAENEWRRRCMCWSTPYKAKNYDRRSFIMRVQIALYQFWYGPCMAVICIRFSDVVEGRALSWANFYVEKKNQPTEAKLNEK